MHKISIKLFVKFLLLLALSIIVVGCSSDSGSKDKSSNRSTKETAGVEDSKPKKGGEVVIGYSVDISSFDPIKGGSGSDDPLLYPVYDRLLSFTPDLQPQPGLAESWETPDDKTLVLHLREGVTFHDGTPFDAEAVKFNIERLKSKESLFADRVTIESVEIVDPLTVKLYLSEINVSTLIALADRAGMMVSPTAVKKYGDDYAQHPVGAGPYKMVKRVPNGEVVFERFDDYWDKGKPYLDKITIKIMTDENTRINALKSGDIDMATRLASPSNIPSLKSDPNLIVEDDITLRFHKIYLNSLMPPFDNKAVRLAVLHGINREELIQSVNFGYGEPAYQPFPKDYWAADKEMTIKYDPEKSKKLLKEAGLENVSFKLLTNTSAYQTSLAEAIKGQLEKVGIDVEIETMELSAAVSKFYNDKSVPALLTSWVGQLDPHLTIRGLYTGYYLVGETPDTLLPLISKANSTYDQGERAQIYKEISKVAVNEEALDIPLFFPPEIYAMNKRIKGFEQNLLGRYMFSAMWIEE